VDTYTALKTAGKAVEVVFISADRDEESFKEYFGEMPWLALPFADRKCVKALSTALEVDGYPTLVVMDKAGQVITSNGRRAVAADPEGKEFPWIPKPVVELTESSGDDLNEIPVLLIVVDSAEGVAERCTELLTPAATASTSAVAAGADRVAFMYGRRSDGMTQRVMEFAGLEGSEDAKEGGPETLLLLDVPGQVMYTLVAKGSDITADAIVQFMADFRAGKLTGKPLGGEEEEEEEERVSE
jgi:nucleoredoxin